MQRRKKAIVTALMIALATVPGFVILLMAAPVSAQFKSRGGGGSKEQEQKKKPADDGQYKSAIERLPDKKFDPWQNMR